MANLQLKFRDAHSDDAGNIISLYKEFRPDWTPIPQLGHIIQQFPSVVAYENEKLKGFAYCIRFAPDILELANIYVDQDSRCNNIGSMILNKIENKILLSKYSGLILTNSDLFKGKENKRSATMFYTRNNYIKVAETNNSRVFYKSL